MWPRKRANRASSSGFTQTTHRASVNRSRLAHRQPGAHSSPVELRADLPNAWIARVGDDSEVRAGDVPARIFKLRVVEYVEKFDTEVKSKVLFNLGPLQEPKIGVVESGAVEEASVGSTKSARIAVNGKRTRKEVTSRSGLGGVDRIRTTGISFARIHNHHGAHNIWHVRGRTARERSIALTLVQLYGKTASEPCDPLHLPPLREALRRIVKSSVERNGPNVTDHKIVSDVAG